MSTKSRQPAKRPVAPESSDFLDDYSPFRIDTSAPALEDGPRIPLFWVDDREYSVPARISAGKAMKMLELSATQGITEAMYWAAVDALGEDGFRELTEGEASRRITTEQLQAVFAKLGKLYYGQAKEAVGK